MDLSRRDFLKLAGASVTVATMPGVAAYLDKNLVSMTTEQLPKLVKNETLADLVLTQGKNFFLRNAKNKVDLESRIFVTSKNPRYRQIPELIHEAINIYDKPVFLGRPNKVFDINDLSELADELNDGAGLTAQYVSVGEMLAYLRNELDLNSSEYKEVTDFMRSIINYHSRFEKYPSMLGLVSKYEGIHDYILSEPYGGMTRISRGEPEKLVAEISAAWNYLRAVFERKNKRVQSPIMLAYFLERNHGNISESIIDLQSLYKVLARNNIRTLDILLHPNFHAEIVARFVFIEDEYSLVGTDFGNDVFLTKGYYDNTVNPDLSTVNRVGLAYHPWAFAARLLTVDRQVLKILGIAEHMMFRGQGNIKSASDFETMLTLKKIEETYASFE